MSRQFDEVVTPHFGLSVCGPVLIQHWERGTPLEGAQRACDLASQLGRSGMPRTASIVVVPPQSALPDSATRKELARLPKLLGPIVGFGMAHEGSGFRASAVRGVLTGIILMTRADYEHEVFANVIAAADWLGERLQGDLTASELIDGVAELRRKVLRV